VCFLLKYFANQNIQGKLSYSSELRKKIAYANTKIVMGYNKITINTTFMHM
jgi:hypothetical protein